MHKISWIDIEGRASMDFLPGENMLAQSAARKYFHRKATDPTVLFVCWHYWAESSYRWMLEAAKVRKKDGEAT